MARRRSARVAALRRRRRARSRAVRGIGLSGQMHGAVLLDAADRVLRPAILWNDGRSRRRVRRARAPRAAQLRAITGNLAMPGFTAPKLLWVAAHEPDVFAATRARAAAEGLPAPAPDRRVRVRHVRRRRHAVARRRRGAPGRRELLAATGLDARAHAAPRRGQRADRHAARATSPTRWGMRPASSSPAAAATTPPARSASASIRPGDAFLSLGTSGVYFVAGDALRARRRQRAVHAFCHCLPRTWHQMSVILSAASCLTWVAAADRRRERGRAARRGRSTPTATRAPIFLPYLSGERTPHNDPARAPASSSA